MLQAAQEMLQESGLQELEQRVLGFLCTNSGNLKLLSTLDDAQRLLHQVTPRPAHQPRVQVVGFGEAAGLDEYQGRQAPSAAPASRRQLLSLLHEQRCAHGPQRLYISASREGAQPRHGPTFASHSGGTVA